MYLEKEMATHSSILAWRIPGMEEPGGLLSMGSRRVGHDWSDLAAAALGINWLLRQRSCGYPFKYDVKLYGDAGSHPASSLGLVSIPSLGFLHPSLSLSMSSHIFHFLKPKDS